jgi:hypothetical protein
MLGLDGLGVFFLVDDILVGGFCDELFGFFFL